MRYLTDRKRAAGLGSAKSGTMHHWHLIVTACALLGLILFFVFTFGPALGGSYDEASAVYGRGFPAVVALLTLCVGFYHFKLGIAAVIEDYTKGLLRKALIIGSVLLSYGAMAVAALSIIRLAL